MVEPKYKTAGESTMTSSDDKRRREILLKKELFDDHYLLLHPDTEMPIKNAAYAIELSDGTVLYGTTTENGMTDFISPTCYPQIVEIYVQGA